MLISSGKRLRRRCTPFSRWRERAHGIYNARAARTPFFSLNRSTARDCASGTEGTRRAVMYGGVGRCARAILALTRSRDARRDGGEREGEEERRAKKSLPEIVGKCIVF